MKEFEILETLVKIKSEIGNEKSICDYLQSNFLPFARRDGNNLVYFEPNADKPYVVLVGHCDTVKIDENQIQRFENDVIYGRGSVDMKSGLAFILNEVSKKRDFPRGFIIYDKEEGPLPNGLTKILSQTELPPIRLAILFEPTSSKVEFGCRGSAHFKAIFKGKVAHSARPHLGENSLYKMDKLLSFLSKLDLPVYKEGDFHYSEHLTATQIGSTGSRNSLPEVSWLNINFRFSPYRSNEDAVSYAFSLLNPFCDVLECVDIANGARPLDKYNSISRWAQNEKNVSYKQAWTDVAQFSWKEIPSFNFGPGNPNLCHMRDEHITKREMEIFEDKLQELMKVLRDD